MSTITVAELALWRRAGFPFKLLDVRRAQARAADGSDIEGGTWLDPALWLDWKDQVQDLNPKGAPVVVYCAHGHEISQGLTAALRAMAIDARHLDGGISAWKQAAHATVPAQTGLLQRSASPGDENDAGSRSAVGGDAPQS